MRFTMLRKKFTSHIAGLKNHFCMEKKETSETKMAWAFLRPSKIQTLS